MTLKQQIDEILELTEEVGVTPEMQWNFVGHNWHETSIYMADKRRLCLLDTEDWGVTEDNQDELEGEQTRLANFISKAPEMASIIRQQQEMIEKMADALELMIVTHHYDRSNCKDIIQARKALSEYNKMMEG